MKKKEFAYIIIAGLLWGTAGVFAHYLAPYGLSPIQMTAIRGCVSLFVLGVYIFFHDRRIFRIKLSHLPLFIAAGIGMFLTSSCYYISMKLTSVSTSVMLMYTAPLFVMCYSVLFMGEKLTKLKIIAVISMFVGCGLISGIIGGMEYNIWGILIGLISGVAYSIYNIITKIEMSKRINPLSSIFYCYIFMAGFAFIVTSPGDIIMVAIQNSFKVTLLMIGLGIFASVLPYFLYTLGLKSMPAGVAASLAVVEPLAATVYSVLLFREKLGIYNIAGIILIIGAVILLSRSQNE